VKLVEQHLIRKIDPRYTVIDQAAFASKNLYNQATYQIRQAFIHEGKYLPYAEVFHRIKHMECYQALPRKVSNSIPDSFGQGIAAPAVVPRQLAV
jgi:putative transposase